MCDCECNFTLLTTNERIIQIRMMWKVKLPEANIHHASEKEG